MILSDPVCHKDLIEEMLERTKQIFHLYPSSKKLLFAPSGDNSVFLEKENGETFVYDDANALLKDIIRLWHCNNPFLNRAVFFMEKTENGYIDITMDSLTNRIDRKKSGFPLITFNMYAKWNSYESLWNFHFNTVFGRNSEVLSSHDQIKHSRYLQDNIGKLTSDRDYLKEWLQWFCQENPDNRNYATVIETLILSFPNKTFTHHNDSETIISIDSKTESLPFFEIALQKN